MPNLLDSIGTPEPAKPVNALDALPSGPSKTNLLDTIGPPDLGVPAAKPSIKTSFKPVIDAADKFLKESVNALPDLISGTTNVIGNFADLTKKVGFSTAARAAVYESRREMGIPMDPAEEQDLAQSLKVYGDLHGPGKVNQFLEQTFSGGMTRAEQKAMEHGLVNLSLLLPSPSHAVTGLTLPAKAIELGSEKLASFIPNVLARKLAAIEAHSIASFVSWNVANAAIEDQNLGKAAIEGTAMGALAPPVFQGVKGLGMLGLDTAMLGAKGAGTGVKATAQAVDRALLRSETYLGARQFLAHQWDKGSPFTLGMGRSGEGLLKAAGAPETATTLRNMSNEAHFQGTDWDARMRTVFHGITRRERNVIGAMLHLSPEEGLAFAQAQGMKNPEFLAARADQARTIFREVGQTAQDMGIPQIDPQTGDIRQFFMRADWGMPHVYVNTERLMKDRGLRKKAIEGLMDFHGMSKAEAEKTLAEIHNLNVAEQQGGYEGLRLANLMGRRYNIPGFNTDPMAVAPEYFAKMARKIQATKFFGPQPAETAQMELPGVGVEAPAVSFGKSVESQYPRAFVEANQIADPERQKLAKDIISRALGAYDTGPFDTQKLTKLMQAEAIMKLGLAQITQATQFVAATIPSGFKDSMSDFLRLGSKSPELQNRLLRTGAFWESVIRQSEEQFSGSSQTAVARNLRRIGFTQLDTQARRFGALRGFTMASHQAEKLAELLPRRDVAKGLEKRYIEDQIAKIEKKFALLNIDAADLIKRGGILSEQDIKMAGQKLSTDVNFWSDTLSLPAFYKTPWGRIMTQFKSFSYQQGIFLKNAVLKPLIEDGDYGPLTRALVGMQLTGEAIGDIKSVLRNKPRTDAGTLRMLHNMLMGGSLGILADAIQAGNIQGGLISMAAGPGIGDIYDTGYGVTQAVFYGHGRPLGKKIVAAGVPMLSTVPYVGPAFALAPVFTPAIVNTLFPPKQPAQ